MTKFVKYWTEFQYLIAHLVIKSFQWQILVQLLFNYFMIVPASVQIFDYSKLFLDSYILKSFFQH